MRVLFGWHLDGAPWSSRGSRLGFVKTGPLGLIDVLQTRLGLTARHETRSKRILQYRKRLQAVDCSDAWHHESFSLAPWATAADLLERRDELVESGWRVTDTRDNGVPRSRLDVLKQAELVDIPLPLGAADFLVEILHTLAALEPDFENPAVASFGISEISLADERELLPAVWQSILDQLERLGTTIGPAAPRKPGASGPSEAVIIDAAEGRSMAEVAARWLGAREERLLATTTSRPTLGIIATTDTTRLDWELTRRGLPQLGVSSPSAYRANEQLLTQIMDLAFAPANPQRLADFLAVPVSPIPRPAARLMLSALSEQPGIGGDAWAEAIEDIKDSDLPDAEQTAADIDLYFNTDLADRSAGLTRAQITNRCRWLVERLRRLVSKQPELMVTISQAEELAGLAESLDTVTEPELQQILHSVVATGSTADGVTGSREQAADWICVTDPAHLPETMDDVLWWGFGDTATRGPHTWITAERAGIDGDIGPGGGLPDSRSLNKLRANADHHLLDAASSRLLLFRDVTAGLPAATAHPLEDVLANRHDVDGAPLTTVNANALTATDGIWRLAGEEARLRATPLAQPQVVRPPTFSGLLNRAITKVSYSQLNALIGCPRFWALKNAAGIKPAPGHDLPDGNRAIGTLAHKVMEDVFTGGPRELGYVPDIRSVESTFDALVPHFNAELLLPGNSALLQRTRRTACDHVVKLFRLLADAEVRIVAMEREFATPLELEAGAADVELRGSIDLLGELPSGRQIIVDLKWTSSKNHHRELIESGEAFQLATYAWALAAETSGGGSTDRPRETPIAGYYLLRQGELLTDSPDLGAPVESPRTLDQVWEVALATARKRLADIRHGHVDCYAERQQRLYDEAIADGASKAAARDALKTLIREAGELYASPPCGFGELGSLCGRLNGQE